MDFLKNIYGSVAEKIGYKKKPKKKSLKLIKQEYTKLKPSPIKNIKKLTSKKLELKTVKDITLNKYKPSLVPTQNVKNLAHYEKPVKKPSPVKPPTIKQKIIKGIYSISNVIKEYTKSNIKPKPKPKQKTKKEIEELITKIKEPGIISENNKISPPFKKNPNYKFGQESKYAVNYEYEEPIFTEEILEAFPDTNIHVLHKLFPNSRTITKIGKKPIINEIYNPNIQKKKNVNKYKNFQKLTTISEYEKKSSPSLPKNKKTNLKIKTPLAQIIEEEEEEEKPKKKITQKEKSKIRSIIEEEEEKPKKKITQKEKSKIRSIIEEEEKKPKRKITQKEKSKIRSIIEEEEKKPKKEKSNVKECPPGKVYNPISGRCVKADGKKGKELNKKI